MHKLAVSHLLAKDVMMNPVVFFTVATTVEQAVELLMKHKISGAPIVDPNTNILLSMASEMDLMQLLAKAPMNEVLLVHYVNLLKQGFYLLYTHVFTI